MPTRNVAVTHGIPKEDAKALILAGLQKGLSPGAAASAVGYSRVTAYRWRDEDSTFAAAWADAVETGTDRAEDEAWRRGVQGVPRKRVHVYRGKVVHTERYQEYSDPMLAMILKARRPGKFREDRPGDGSAPVQVVIYIPDNGRPMGTAVQVVAPGLPSPRDTVSPDEG